MSAHAFELPPGVELSSMVSFRREEKGLPEGCFARFFFVISKTLYDDVWPTYHPNREAFSEETLIVSSTFELFQNQWQLALLRNDDKPNLGMSLVDDKRTEGQGQRVLKWRFSFQLSNGHKLQGKQQSTFVSEHLSWVTLSSYELWYPLTRHAEHFALIWPDNQATIMIDILDPEREPPCQMWPRLDPTIKQRPFPSLCQLAARHVWQQLMERPAELVPSLSALLNSTPLAEELLVNLNPLSSPAVVWELRKNPFLRPLLPLTTYLHSIHVHEELYLSNIRQGTAEVPRDSFLHHLLQMTPRSPHTFCEVKAEEQDYYDEIFNPDCHVAPFDTAEQFMLFNQPRRLWMSAVKAELIDVFDPLSFSTFVFPSAEDEAEERQLFGALTFSDHMPDRTAASLLRCPLQNPKAIPYFSLFDAYGDDFKEIADGQEGDEEAEAEAEGEGEAEGEEGELEEVQYAKAWNEEEEEKAEEEQQQEEEKEEEKEEKVQEEGEEGDNYGEGEGEDEDEGEDEGEGEDEDEGEGEGEGEGEPFVPSLPPRPTWQKHELGASPYGQPSIVDHPTFLKQFSIFTDGIFEGWHNWDRMVVLGGSVVASLLPVPAQFRGSEEQVQRFYRHLAYAGSDIDLYFYGLSEQEFGARVAALQQHLSSLPGNEVLVFQSEWTVTLYNKWPRRKVQLVKGKWQTLAELVYEPDIDATCVAFDGSRVWATARSRLALNYRTNFPCQRLFLERRHPEYEERLYKYSRRGFYLASPFLRSNLSGWYAGCTKRRLSERNAIQSRSSVVGLRILLAAYLFPQLTSSVDLFSAVNQPGDRAVLPWGPATDLKAVIERLKAGLTEWGTYGPQHYPSPYRLIAGPGQPLPEDLVFQLRSLYQPHDIQPLKWFEANESITFTGYLRIEDIPLFDTPSCHRQPLIFA